MQWLKYVERLYNRPASKELEQRQSKTSSTPKENDGTFWGMSANDALSVNIVTKECGRKF
ncbi:hypothetical protein BTA51_10995 [Hahella sp. CCB-MM4]|uniref:hypothetical protein n=1 Tax=Hahella sp. (strain CCB-MM4) TaxID=1926491 RepID=UPI000B9A7B05|nr:hypothetical protein [Hahella sp. CCB-MM4]OZG73530.1 hypothetical protein BTA51_10995 [Hahella sp. CCB-MM4]